MIGCLIVRFVCDMQRWWWWWWWCVCCSYWTCVFWMPAAYSSPTVCLLPQPCFMSTHKMLHCPSLVGFSLLV